MALENCCGCFRSSKSVLKGIEYKLPKNLSVTDYFRKCIIENTIDGDSPAVVAEDGYTISLTFSKLDSLSTKLAKALRHRLGYWTCNNRDFDLVMCLSLPISPHIPVVILAILKLGAAFLAIPTIYPEQFIAKIVNVIRPIAVITDTKSSPMSRYDFVSGLVTLVDFDELLHMAMFGGFDDINEVFPLETLVLPAARIASIVFTAGTMDQQLAVRIGHSEILNRCLWQYKEFPYSEGEIQAVSSGLEDVDSIAELFAPLLAGVPLHLIPRSIFTEPSALLNRIQESKISRITLGPPALATLLTAYDELDDANKELRPFQCVKYWIISGDAMSQELVDRFFYLVAPEKLPSHHHHHSHHPNKPKQPHHHDHSHDPPVTLIHLYGSTEVMSDVTYETFENCCHLQTKFKNEKVSIGKPIGNTIVYIVDEDMRLVENGVIGEICIAGAPVASGGYVSGTDGEDAERFCTNPFTKKKGYTTIYQTEDLGKLDFREGVPHLFYEGRTELTAKVKGKRVDLRDISKLVNETKLVEQCFALCFHPGKLDQSIVAFCKLLPDITNNQLKETLKANIKEEHLVPEIFPVEQFYYLPSGRLDKHKLLKQYFYDTMNASPEEWQTVSLTAQQKTSAKILFAAIAKYTRKTIRQVIDGHTGSLWTLGVNSLSALAIFLNLREKGFIMNIDTFMKANSLLSIVEGMKTKSKNDYSVVNVQRFKLFDMCHEHFYTHELKQDQKQSVIDMLTKSYAWKSDICKHLKMTCAELTKFFEDQWKQIMKDNMSLVAYDAGSYNSEKPVGVVIVVDASASLKTCSNCPQTIKYWVDLMNSLEKDPKEHIVWKKKGTASQIAFLGTLETMSAPNNTMIVAILFEAAKVAAKSKGYSGTIVSSENPLVTDLCEGILDYKVLEEVPIYTFRAKDKTLPFRLLSEYITMQVLYESF